ncbi:MAG: hypothetical protein SF002_03815 [Alphaproteobacteria bacterium]|nr:hypothetical protein [Alphaproteobacteria bacterium]
MYLFPNNPFFEEVACVVKLLVTECEPVLLASGAVTETISEVKSDLRTFIASFFGAFPGEIRELLYNDDPCDLALEILRIRNLVDENGAVARVYRQYREKNPLEYTTFGATENLTEENQRLRKRQAEIEQKQHILESNLKLQQNITNLHRNHNSPFTAMLHNPSGFSVSKVGDFESEETLDWLKDLDLQK